MDLRTAVRRQVLVTNLASTMFSFSMFAMSLVLPQLVQLPQATGYGLGQSILVVGLVMAPQGLVTMATAPLSARLSRIKGPKVTLMAGAVMVAAGYGLSVVLMSAIWQLVLVSCVIGAVPVSETAADNSLNTLMRAIGTSISSTVIGVVLAQLTTTIGATTIPSHNGFRVVMAIGCGAALLALAIASLLPRARPAHPPAPTRPQSGR